MAKMTKEQRDYLWGRMRTAATAQEYPWEEREDAPRPPEVRKAEALVARWKATERKKRERANEALEKRRRAYSEIHYNGDYQAALAALKRFEAGK